MIKIAIAGDSTVSDASPGEPNPQPGWGQLLPVYVDEKRVKITNFAKAGRSTKTFKSEGRWAKLLASHPDYVYIQFGHNDSHAKEKPEATDAATDYTAYLREFVQTARAQNAKPLLVTPMHRALWDKTTGHLTRELLPYADATRAVAREMKVPLIDLYARSETAYESMGLEKVRPFLARNGDDRTHFVEAGAKLMAGFVAQETARVVPRLRPLLRPPA
jgi:lysophospholipase L1-like esterase